MFSPLSDIDVCRMALREVGDATPLDAFDDTTEAAARCNEFYPQMKGVFLSSAPWPWAKRHQLLSQNLGWDAELASTRSYKYGYTLPDDLVKVREVWSGSTRVSDNRQAIPYDFALLAGVPILVTNLSEAELVYTANCEVAVFPYLAREALKWLVADKLAVGLRVSGALAARAAQMSRYALKLAIADSMNNVRPEPEPTSILFSRRRF